MNNKSIKFIKNVESRVTPEKLSIVANGASKLMKLPKFIQNYIVILNSKNNSYMGFIVEPYSFFLAYEITEDLVKKYLPEDYELVPISLFNNSDKKFTAIIGCFNVKTSVFFGSRFELYIIAKNKKSGLVSWIICDYESDTYNYDPGNGFVPATLEKSIYTTSFNGNIICDIKGKNSNTQIDLVIDITKYDCSILDQKLWLEGNLSVDYSGKLDNNGKDPFGLIFDPLEMTSANAIQNDQIHINKIEFSFINSSMIPYEACYFPYAQHYLTTVFPEESKVKNEIDLYEKIDEIISKM